MEEQSGNNTAQRMREIRVALALYGGVSLAVYENGVTRAFFELVKGRGVFDIVLNLLDAEAKVDVITGTSAGGINGLMLAAALESGTDFKQTADLWRNHGDIGALLRPVAEADKAFSLLDGEGYYQEKLTDAFEALLQPDSQALSPGEMDVFITGTDLDGRVSTYWDELGHRIDDKRHRMVFHLKHRPGRRYLGLAAEASKAENVKQQATILASIARITSTFPAAFPPFELNKINAYREEIGQALEKCGDADRQHAFVDGGVLDNKPFEPALKAIFYRMPSKLVDRRLYFVEPDPEILTEIADTGKLRTPNPLGVIAASLTSIPSHESIAAELEALKAHNARIRWLSELKNEVVLEIEKNPLMVDIPVRALYCKTRSDSLAKMLLWQSDDTPAADSSFVDPARRAFCDVLKVSLQAIGQSANGLAALDSCDVDFQLRRTFFLLYQLYAALQNQTGKDRQKYLGAVQALGRVIKLLEIIRAGLMLLRDKTIDGFLNSAGPSADALLVFFNHFLNAANEPWKRLASLLTAEIKSDADLLAFANRESGHLSSAMLTMLNTEVRAAVARLSGLLPEQAPYQMAQRTILDCIAGLIEDVVRLTTGNVKLYNAFQAVDALFFPLEYSSGVHELDEIEVVRISPRDAQTGLSAMDAASKVTGDELAHFAAFFRRDWRANDMLWGRLDAYCQIVESLLDTASLDFLKLRRVEIENMISRDYLKSRLQRCPDTHLEALMTVWQEFIDALVHESSSAGLAAVYRRFVRQLILAAQHDAVHEDLPGVYEDLYCQEISWGTYRDAKVSSGANPVAVRAEAKKAAQDTLTVFADRLGESFQDLRFGDQTVAGRKGAVPRAVLGEYAAQSYLLLWGMLNSALGGHKRKVAFLGQLKFRMLFRYPILALYHLLALMRTETSLFWTVTGAIILVLLSIGVTALFLSISKTSAVLILAGAFVLMAFCNWVHRGKNRSAISPAPKK